MPLLVVFLILILLIFINGWYVAAEFSSVSARRSRLAQDAAAGNRLAQAILPILENPQNLDRYIATCQLGITASSLLLGFYGQAALSDTLAPLFVAFGGFSEVAARSAGATIVLLILTFLQALLGELLPKNIGLQYPERMALVTVIPTRWSMALFRPLIWFFNGSGQLILRLLGLTPVAEHTHIHAPEEILMLVEESSAGGLLDREERRLLENTLTLWDSMVRKIMRPRTRILAAPIDQPCQELLALLADSSFSRLPLYDRTIDNIVGVVHLKDLLCLSHQQDCSPLEKVMRAVLFVPETAPVGQVFSQLQRRQDHLAIVLDEFGGTSGMVTLEDLIEEIFGELEDEFDLAKPPIRLVSGNRVRIRGDTQIDSLNNWLNLFLFSPDVDTIGGLVLSEIGHVPEVGDSVQIAGHTFKVEAMDGKGVTAVSMEIDPKRAKRLKDI